MMQKMSSFDLYEQLKRVDSDIKVCFLTASEMYYERNRGIEHCALNKGMFLQKPISTNNLIMEVNKKIYSDNNG
jgi:CheY-like chemotaxis protein